MVLTLSRCRKLLDESMVETAKHSEIFIDAYFNAQLYMPSLKKHFHYHDMAAIQMLETTIN